MTHKCCHCLSGQTKVGRNESRRPTHLTMVITYCAQRECGDICIYTCRNFINDHKALKSTHSGNVVKAGVVLVLCEPPGGSDPLCAHKNNLHARKSGGFKNKGGKWLDETEIFCMFPPRIGKMIAKNLGVGEKKTLKNSQQNCV